MVASVVLFLFVALWAQAGEQANTNSASAEARKWYDDRLRAFFAAKMAEARELDAQAKTNKMPADVWRYFEAGTNGNWRSVSNIYYRLESEMRSARPSAFQPMSETDGVWEDFETMGEKYSLLFAKEVIRVVPRGAIYFGGTDPGRFVITAMMKSHAGADPFFVLTQNALADGNYLAYLRKMYDGKIYIPTDEDSQIAFQSYMYQAQQRLIHDQRHPNEPRQVKPGEEVRMDGGGHVQVSGQIAVMEINALLVKKIFDENPNREFYIEESFPLDWMFSRLTPEGLILKINREPVPELTEEMIRRDHDYWKQLVTPMIGDWLTYDTTTLQLIDYVDKVFAKQDFRNFRGDRQLIEHDDACKAFSKWRSAIGGVYAWRIGLPPAGGTTPKEYLAKDETQRQQLGKEADFAYKQAFALCPYSPEALYRYVNLLIAQMRTSDALLIANTSARLAAPESRPQFEDLVQRIKEIDKQVRQSQALQDQQNKTNSPGR